MSRHALARTSGRRCLHALAAGVAVLQLSLPAPTLAQQVTMETLLDRIQIEDMRPHNGMLLTNPVMPPSLYEQGREDTELVKVDGKWLISKRYISSDSGLPDRFDQTFKQRDNPLAPL